MTRKLSLICLSFVVLVMLQSCGSSPPVFNGINITGANYGRDFKLTDPEGRQRTPVDFRGKYVALFFGFTHCPGICPTTLAQLADARKKLGAEASRVQVIFVTVDPEQDTAEVLKTYTHAFDPSFIGLRGDPAATETAAKEFRIFYRKIPTTNGAYMMDHSAITYILDPQGRLRLAMPNGMTADQFAADLRTLMKSAA